MDGRDGKFENVQSLVRYLDVVREGALYFFMLKFSNVLQGSSVDMAELFAFLTGRRDTSKESSLNTVLTVEYLPSCSGSVCNYQSVGERSARISHTALLKSRPSAELAVSQHLSHP